MFENIATAEQSIKDNRFASLDVLRGIAILFVLILNIQAMGGFPNSEIRHIGWTAADKVGWAVMELLEGTQRGLLELLFGAGIAIMSERVSRRDGLTCIADLQYRRNWLLVGFGLFNALVLLWPGDILVEYGLIAMLIFPARLLKARVQIAITALCMALSTLQYVHPVIDEVANYSAAKSVLAKVEAHRSLNDLERNQLRAIEVRLKSQSEVSPEVRAVMARERASRMGQFRTYAVARWRSLHRVYDIDVLTDILPEIAGSMILGMALFRLGFLQGLSRNSTYILTLISGYGIALVVRGYVIAQGMNVTLTPMETTAYELEQFSRIPMCLAHLSAIHLALETTFGRQLLLPFGANGRMPLTTYLSASLITMWVLFPAAGLGLWGRYSYGGLVAIALAIILCQLIAANIWMRYFETGPLEWVWKSLTYKRRLPLKRPVPRGPLHSLKQPSRKGNGCPPDQRPGHIV